MASYLCNMLSVMSLKLNRRVLSNNVCLLHELVGNYIVIMSFVGPFLLIHSAPVHFKCNCSSSYHLG